jgi:cytochrome b subunit of formate dehydrogenase
MYRLGDFVKSLMAKFWIWVVAIMLFVIGITGTQMTMFRTVYMVLFLVFLLVFQVSS